MYSSCDFSFGHTHSAQRNQKRFGSCSCIARLMRDSDKVSACRGAYTTFLSGATYVPGVQCLLTSAARAGAVCPFVVLYDDRERVALPTAALAALKAAMRPTDVLVPLTSLYKTLGVDKLRKHAYTGVEICPDPTSTREGRRLYEKSEYTTPWLKLWLWALPASRYEHLLYLDADIAFLHNLDHVLMHPPSLIERQTDEELEEHAKAAAAAARATAAAASSPPLPHGGGVSLYASAAAQCPRQTAFNSGVMLFKPSLLQVRSRCAKTHALTALSQPHTQSMSPCLRS